MILASAESILKSNTDIFSQSDFVTDFLRVIGWKGIKILRTLAKGVESLFDAVYDFLNITNSSVFQNFYDQYRPLIVVGFVISLIVLGTIYMLTEKRPEVLKNFIIGLLVIFATPTFIQYLNEAIFASKAYLANDLSSADSVISSNITDLLYLDSIGWDIKSGTNNSLNEDAISHLNPSEHVTKKNDVSSLGQQIFDTQIIVKADGKVKTGDMGSKGWGDIFDPPYYYRYNIHYFQIAILLIIFMLVIVFASYKTFLLIYEIMNSRIIGSLLAMDLTSGQKLKKVIEGFFSAYFSLFYILVSLKLYAITQAYINAQSYGPIVRTFMLLFAGFLVMDGPNLIEKIFGYDIGFGSGAQKFMSLMRLGMEGMQLKYYAQNMGMGLGNLGKNLSGLGSSLNNKFSLNNATKADTPEPPTNPNPGEKAAYSAAEPNATSNSQNYNSGFTADNKSKDVPNSSGNNEMNQNDVSNTGNDQILNGENGTSYSTNEPPMSSSELNDHNTNSNELPKGDSGLEDSTNGTMSDIPVSSSDSNELNNTESSLQESGQHNENDKQKYGHDSQNSSNVSDREPHTFSGNSSQDSFANSSENGSDISSNLNNNTSNNSTEDKTLNSSIQGESNQPSNNYDQANTSMDRGNETKTGADQLSHSVEPNSNEHNNKGVSATGNNTSEMGKAGATNSTEKNSNSDKQQNGHMDSNKERLMDKKFGTESIAPQIISALPKEEPNLNSSNSSPDLPGAQDNSPISNTDSSGKYGEDIVGSEYSGKTDRDNTDIKPKTNISSSIGSPHSDRASGQEHSNMKPLSNIENDSISSTNGHSPRGRSEQGTSSTDASNHNDSVMSKPAYQTTGTGTHSNTGDIPIETIGDKGVSPNGSYSSSPALESAGLSNETIQSNIPLSQESSYDSSGNTRYVSSESGLRLNESLLNNQADTEIGKTENPKNLNATDVLNAANPELPKGDKGEESGKTGKADKTDKKATGTRSNGINKKKR